MSGRRVWISGFAVAAAVVVAVVLVIKFVLLGPSPALASFTTLSVISDTVEVQDEGASEFRRAVDGEVLKAGQRVRTGPDGRAVLTFYEGTTATLEPGTDVVIQALERSGDHGFFTSLRQSAGITWNRVVEFTDPASGYEVETAAGVAAVRGTTFSVEEDGITRIRVREGVVVARAKGREVTVEAGMETSIVPGESPSDPTETPGSGNTVVVELGSPAWLSIVDPDGLTAGFVPPGVAVNQILGATTSSPGDGPQRVTLYELKDGVYEIFLVPHSTGGYQLDVEGLRDAREVFSIEASGEMAVDEWESALLQLIMFRGSLVGGRLFGPTCTESELPGRVVLTEYVLAGFGEEGHRVVRRVSCSGEVVVVPTPTRTPASQQQTSEVAGVIAVPIAAFTPVGTRPSPSPQALARSKPPTPRPTGGILPSPSPAPAEMSTAVPTSTAAETGTPAPTPTKTPVRTPTPTPMPTPTVVPTNTPLPSPTPTSTPRPTSTPTPTATPTNTPRPTNTPTPTPVPTSTPTPTRTSTPTSTPVPGPIAVSFFDYSREGWSVVGGAQSGLPPDYLRVGGNPGGHICATDDVGPQGDVWYWQAPAGFLGDVSGAYMRALTFDLKQSRVNMQFDWDDVVLVGGGVTLVFDTPYNPGTNWTTYSIPLHESAGWKNKATGLPPTHAEMLAVLSSLTELRLRGEYEVLADTGCLDNVVLGR